MMAKRTPQRRTRGEAVARVSLLVAIVGIAAHAQVTDRRTPEQIKASFDAHKGEFDYLLGDWEFTATSQAYGRFKGYWSAMRLEKGQILDEYRVVGDKGETYYVTTTLRNYNGALDRWELVGADAGSGLQDTGTAHKEGTEMRVEQTFGVASGKPSLWRIRYYDIGVDHLRVPGSSALGIGSLSFRNVHGQS